MIKYIITYIICIALYNNYKYIYIMHITASFASTENCLVFGTSDVLSS